MVLFCQRLEDADDIVGDLSDRYDRRCDYSGLCSVYDDFFCCFGRHSDLLDWVRGLMVIG